LETDLHKGSYAYTSQANYLFTPNKINIDSLVLENVLLLYIFFLLLGIFADVSSTFPTLF